MSKIPFEDIQIPTDGTYKMPFGIHKDLTIEEIPSGYLAWMCREGTNPGIVKACRAELQWRDQNQTHFNDDDEWISGPDEAEFFDDDIQEVTFNGKD